jgi:hypothetical protein
MSRDETLRAVQEQARRRLAQMQARILANKQASAVLAGGAVFALLIMARARRSSRG